MRKIIVLLMAGLAGLTPAIFGLIEAQRYAPDIVGVSASVLAFMLCVTVFLYANGANRFWVYGLFCIALGLAVIGLANLAGIYFQPCGETCFQLPAKSSASYLTLATTAAIAFGFLSFCLGLMAGRAKEPHDDGWR